MNDKVVFFDIDGTLLDHNKKVPLSTKNAIKELKDKGVHVAIATGRSPSMFGHIRNELDIHNYVCCNGSYAIFHDEVIYERALDREELQNIIAIARDNSHPLIFANHESVWARPEDKAVAKLFAHHLKVDVPEEREHNGSENVFHAMLFCTEEHEKLYSNHCYNLQFIRWDQYSTDILPTGGSKAVGVKKFLEKLNIPIHHSFAFGDGINDIEMLQTVGTGIAMGNASERVKQAADIVTTDVADDGIYEGLKKVGLL